MYNKDMNKTLIKNITLIIVVALLLGSATFTVQAKNLKPNDSGWKLQWSDEFSGKELNEDVWTYDIGTGFSGWGNNELESYTDRKANVRVKNGNLVIHAKKEKYGLSHYTSGRLKTTNKKTFKYGKIEARMKVAGGNQPAV